MFGGAELDFRDAVLPGGEVTVKAICVFGGLEITVPPEMRVIDSGVAILGGREIDSKTAESSATTRRCSGHRSLRARRHRGQAQGAQEARRR